MSSLVVRQIRLIKVPAHETDKQIHLGKEGILGRRQFGPLRAAQAGKAPEEAAHLRLERLLQLGKKGVEPLAPLLAEGFPFLKPADVVIQKGLHCVLETKENRVGSLTCWPSDSNNVKT